MGKVLDPIVNKVKREDFTVDKLEEDNDQVLASRMDGDKYM